MTASGEVCPLLSGANQITVTFPLSGHTPGGPGPWGRTPGSAPRPGKKRSERRRRRRRGGVSNPFEDPLSFIGDLFVIRISMCGAVTGQLRRLEEEVQEVAAVRPAVAWRPSPADL